MSTQKLPVELSKSLDINKVYFELHKTRIKIRSPSKARPGLHSRRDAQGELYILTKPDGKV